MQDDAERQLQGLIELIGKGKYVMNGSHRVILTVVVLVVTLFIAFAFKFHVPELSYWDRWPDVVAGTGLLLKGDSGERYDDNKV